MNQLCCLAMVAFIWHSLGFQIADAGELRARVSVRNITTDEPTEPVHGPLLARALVLEVGDNQVVIVAVNLIFVSEALTWNVGCQVNEQSTRG